MNYKNLLIIDSKMTKEQTDNDYIKRNSMLNSIDFHTRKNKFCERSLLTNEAAVENFFINRLFVDIGYKDCNIKTKESIESFVISEGAKKNNYKLDYIITDNNIPLLVVDAKHPHEAIENHVGQCGHYCLLLNSNKKTIKYFLLTNGLKTSLYKWDKLNESIITLDFEDFYIGNTKYEEFIHLLALKELHLTNIVEDIKEKYVTIKKINKEEAQKLFKACHKYIWNAEKRGVGSAFIEFVKLIFLKLWNDRKLHEQYEPNADGYLKVPIISNSFSENWIERHEEDMFNPMNDIQFKDLMNHLQDNIDIHKKKQLFDQEERINITPTTIKGRGWLKNWKNMIYLELMKI